MTPGERWLTATWPDVRACLPAAPARVVEVGCGPLGGFVPMLRANRYDAVGIDPRAPAVVPRQEQNADGGDVAGVGADLLRVVVT